MKTDATVNAVLNDIMASASAGVLLYAPKNYDKEDFLSELGNRYYKSYWFNGYIHDLHQPAVCLLDKLLQDEPAMKLRLKQLLFCQSRYNGPNVVLAAILDYLSKNQREIVIVFEKMDLLPDDYDFTQYIYLIKHAPKNVKIVLSSDKFLNMEISGFEPDCPLLIDETSLIRCSDLCPVDEYLEDISKEELAFLKFVTSYGIISDRLAEKILSGSVALLDMLSRKGIYVSRRNVEEGKYYTFKHDLFEYLESVKDEFEEYSAKYSGNILEAIFNSLYADGLYFEALNIAGHDGNYAYIEKAAKGILGMDSVKNAADYVAVHSEFKFAENLAPEEYPYIALLYVAYVAKHEKRHADCLARIARVEDAMLKLPDGKCGYLCAVYIELVCLIRLGLQERFESRMKELSDSLNGGTDSLDWKTLCTLLPEFVQHSDVDIEELEGLLDIPDAESKFWYLKLLEEIELYYYKIGNYRRSMETARKIKELCPGYVIPLRVIAMNYFEGDIKSTRQLLDEAIAFSERDKRFSDMHLLYSVKALIANYYGEHEDVKIYSDKAYALISGEDASFEKFFTVYTRCYLKASDGEWSYARNLAQIYLKYAKEHAPKYVEMMLQAYAYALYKSGDGDRAYKFAKKAIAAATNKTFVWLYSMGLASNYLLVKGEMKDVESIVANLLRYSDNYGMRMVIVDNAADIFEPIIRYAREHDVEPGIVKKIDKVIARKNVGTAEVKGLKVNLFGSTSITVGGVELQWKTRKSKELFLHYIVAGEIGIDRNIIIEFLWKDYLYESAINNLKTTNNIIRKTLQNNNVEFKLDYLNSRYSLKIYNLTSDLDIYRDLARRFAMEGDLMRKAMIMKEILKVYKSDFALDMHYADFEHERTGIKQEMVLNLMKLIRALAREKRYIEAKEFLSSLVLIDKKNDYKHLVDELDKFINLT